MDEMYLLLVAAIIVALIAIGTRRRTTKMRKPYQCLTARMEWEGSTPADDRIKRILSERAVRIGGQRTEAISDETKSEHVEIFCGNQFHRDR